MADELIDPRVVQALALVCPAFWPRHTGLTPAELIVAVRVPPPPEGLGSAYLRLSARSKVDMSAVGVAAALLLRDGRVRAAHLALASVAPTPLRCERSNGTLLLQRNKAWLRWPRKRPANVPIATLLHCVHAASRNTQN